MKHRAMDEEKVSPPDFHRDMKFVYGQKCPDISTRRIFQIMKGVFFSSWRFCVINSRVITVHFLLLNLFPSQRQCLLFAFNL